MSSPPPLLSLNTALLELFRGHGIDAELRDDGIHLPPTGRLHASAAVVREMPAPDGVTLQIDVRLVIAPGRTVVESFAGIGATREDAVVDGLQNFASPTFHVLLAAFVRPDTHDEQVTRETWDFGGTARSVTFGPLALRSYDGDLGNNGASEPGSPLVAPVERFQERLKQATLSPRTHWVRLFYARQADGQEMCEVLCDNEAWEPLQTETSTLGWPMTNTFYSVRAFFVIDAVSPSEDVTVTAEDAVTCLADLAAENPDLDEEGLYAALADAGVPREAADRAYRFTLTAWGRILLGGMGIVFSDDYAGFDAAGIVVESGRLTDSPYFAAAQRLASRYQGTPAFQRLALASADISAVNDALNHGSKPENLKMAPAIYCFEDLTPSGKKRVEEYLARALAMMPERKATSAPPTVRSPAPWWKFWDRRR